jgi:hypothetical protein
MMGMNLKISEKYRLRALECEKLAREVLNCDVKAAWTEIAIEWHALASRRAYEVSLEQELETALDGVNAESLEARKPRLVNPQNAFKRF